jgi:ketosteroid isomerase-like protein
MAMTTEQQAAESAIRALIERWAAAVRAADLEGVLAVAHEHHSFPARD